MASLAAIKFISIYFVILDILYLGILAASFFIAGFVAGENSFRRIYGLLLIYLSVSIPVMFIQVLGWTDDVYRWSTDLLHDTERFSSLAAAHSESIPVSNVLLSQGRDFSFYMWQARPTGFLNANNLLSLVVILTAAIGIIRMRRSDLGVEHVVCVMCAALIMSKMVFVGYILMFVLALLFRRASFLVLIFKNIIVLLLVVCIYALMFPGLFEGNFGIWAWSWSVGVRLKDIASVLEFDWLLNSDWFSNPVFGLNQVFNLESTASGFAALARASSPVILLGVVLVSLLSLRPLWAIMRRYKISFEFTLFVSILVLGFAVVPVLFKSILTCFLLGLCASLIWARRRDAAWQVPLASPR